MLFAIERDFEAIIPKAKAPINVLIKTNIDNYLNNKYDLP